MGRRRKAIDARTGTAGSFLSFSALRDFLRDLERDETVDQGDEWSTALRLPPGREESDMDFRVNAHATLVGVLLFAGVAGHELGAIDTARTQLGPA